MDFFGSGLRESGRQATFQNPRGKDEKQWQQERLNREEAYYRFINELSDEDYKLMRDRSLLGTPGEITTDELQQRLQGTKEHLISQSNTENSEGDTVRYSETLGRNSTRDSLPEWLNMLHRTGNPTPGEQTWRAMSQVNPTGRRFQFSLEINVNHEYNGGDGPNEESEGVLQGHGLRNHAESTLPIADSPIASRTRSRVLRERFAREIASPRNGDRSGPVAQNGEMPQLFSGRHSSSRNSSSATHNTFLDDNEHNIIRQRRVPRATSMGLHSRRARASSWRRTRQSSEVLRSQSQSLLERWQRRDTQQVQSSRRTRTAHSPPQEDEAQVPSLDVIMEEEASGTSLTILGRHPSITLDFQVRRMRPEAYRDQQGTDIRTGMAENLVASVSNSDFQTISQPEHTGTGTYDSTARILPRRLSETGLVESSSVGLRSIIRQVMTELRDLRSLIDVESYHTIQRGVQHLSEMQSELFDLQSLSSIGELRETSLGSNPAEQGSREWGREASAMQHGGQGDGTQNPSQFQDGDHLIGNGTLPILRLVPYLLLDDYYANDCLRGLTKDQMDSLSTRSYGATTAEEGEINKTCSVCMNDYAMGSKLRQLPCMHEFHFHCIDRWLSENRTCPICRRSVVT